MYNEQIKQQFMEERSSERVVDPHYFSRLFRKTEPYEEKLGKDVSCFTVEEIENMYKTLDYRSLSSLCVDNSTLYIYGNWCLERMMVPDAQNHFVEFGRSRLIGLVNVNQVAASIVRYEDVKKWTIQLRNPSDAFIIYGLFHGIAGKNFCEFWSMSIHDIDPDAREINLCERGKKKYPLDLCELGILSAETFEYYTANQVRKLTETDMVMKDQLWAVEDPGDFRKGRRIYHRILRSLKYLGLQGRVTAKTILDSGCLHMIATKSEEFGIDATEYINTHEEDIAYYYDGFNRNLFIGQYGDLLS